MNSEGIAADCAFLEDVDVGAAVGGLASNEAVRSVSLSLASPETVLSWSYGEVEHASSYDFATGKPVEGGLFCPKIFGSPNEGECLCDEPTADDEMVCAVCGVEMAVDWRCARSRFAHIDLAAPVVHA